MQVNDVKNDLKNKNILIIQNILMKVLILSNVYTNCPDCNTSWITIGLDSIFSIGEHICSKHKKNKIVLSCNPMLGSKILSAWWMSAFNEVFFDVKYHNTYTKNDDYYIVAL